MIMKTLLLLFFFCPAILFGAPAAPDPADKIAANAELSIERAGHCTDTAALANAVRLLDNALVATPDEPALLYARGYACYVNSGLHRRPGDQAALEQCLRDAVGFLERVKGEPWEAEAAALRGTALGTLIGLQKDPAQAGATLGVESSRLLALAASAAPGSPRVLLFRGQALLFTPQEFGGDPAEGAALIKQAVDRFAGAGASPTGPTWGHADALAWLGIAKKQAGDLAAARAAWQQALVIEPNYAWVKYALLPTLDQRPPAK
jgi:tetratricopeptide (TPR) repeat protein